MVWLLTRSWDYCPDFLVAEDGRMATLDHVYNFCLGSQDKGFLHFD